MDTSMAVSREKIKALREARAWSQAHLAEAASLSLRTVQRVEAEGNASAETRLAIAAALDVSVDDLNVPEAVVPVPAPAAPRPLRVDPGAFDTVLMLAAFTAALLYMMWRGSTLPAQVATHFGVAGDVNGHMSRDGFVTAMVLSAAGIAAAPWLALGWRLKRGRIKIPEADYWFAEARRRETLAWLCRHIAWLSVAVIAFVAFSFWLIADANAVAGPPALDMLAMMIGVAVFMAVLGAWIAVLSRRFRHVPA